MESPPQPSLVFILLPLPFGAGAVVTRITAVASLLVSLPARSPPFSSFSELYWNDCSKLQSDRHCFAKNRWLAPCSLVVPWCPGAQDTHLVTSSPEVLRFYHFSSYLQGLLTQGSLSPTSGEAWEFVFLTSSWELLLKQDPHCGK